MGCRDGDEKAFCDVRMALGSPPLSLLLSSCTNGARQHSGDEPETDPKRLATPPITRHSPRSLSSPHICPIPHPSVSLLFSLVRGRCMRALGVRRTTRPREDLRLNPLRPPAGPPVLGLACSLPPWSLQLPRTFALCPLWLTLHPAPTEPPPTVEAKLDARITSDLELALSHSA